MTYDEIVSDVSARVGLTRTLVDKIYRSYWKAVREHIESLPLKDDLSDEEFQKLQPNVNIPSIGKFNVTLGRYQRMKRSMEIINKKKQEKDVTHNKN